MNSINIVLIFSIINLLLIPVSSSYLDLYKINSINDIHPTLSNMFTIIRNGDLYCFYLIIGTTTSILSIVIAYQCIKSIIYLVSEEIYNNHILFNILLTLLCILNILTIIYSFYLLSFLLIIIIISSFAAFILFSNSISGSVHVRGHYRKGTYVRSHTRRRPR